MREKGRGGCQHHAQQVVSRTLLQQTMDVVHQVSDAQIQYQTRQWANWEQRMDAESAEWGVDAYNYILVRSWQELSSRLDEKNNGLNF